MDQSPHAVAGGQSVPVASVSLGFSCANSTQLERICRMHPQQLIFLLSRPLYSREKALLLGQVELGFGRCLFGVHSAVGGDQKFIQVLAVEGIEGDAGADRKRRMFALVAKAL